MSDAKANFSILSLANNNLSDALFDFSSGQTKAVACDGGNLILTWLSLPYAYLHALEYIEKKNTDNSAFNLCSLNCIICLLF